MKEQLEQAKDYAAGKAVELNDKADAKADSWIMGAATWMASFRFSWGFLLGAGAAAGLILFVL